jgi:hypothetical protein
MRRRDISKVLFASTSVAAASALVSKTVQAQSCAAACYPVTANELAAEVINTSYPECNLLRYGADPTGATSSQTAINNWIAVIARANRPGYAPSGKYLFSTGIVVPGAFPGFVGDGYFKTRFFFDSLAAGAVAFTFNFANNAGVYRDFGVNAGASDSESVGRAALRNGIYWRCYGGQGHISNIGVYNFNGFGQKFEAIWDSLVENVVTVGCGNDSEYAFSVTNGTDTSNHTVFNRVQAELSYSKALYLDGLNLLFIEVHSERTQGSTSGAYTHVFFGDIGVISGRIEGSSNVKGYIGIANGFIQALKLIAPTEFAYGARVGKALTLQDCSFRDFTVLSNNLRHVHFINCDLTNFSSAYAERPTVLTDSVISGNVSLTSGAKLVLRHSMVQGSWSVSDANAVEAYDGSEITNPPATTITVARLGLYRLWIDSSGRLRIKNGAPISNTDGTVVGTQA